MNNFSEEEVEVVQTVLAKMAYKMWPRGNDGTREDLVQTAWVRLLAGSPYDPAKGVPFAGWVGQRAKWAIQDALRIRSGMGAARKGRRFTPLSIKESMPAPERRADDLIFQSRLSKSLLSLTSMDRDTVAHLEEPVSQEADRLHLTVHAIAYRRAAALRKLRAAFSLPEGATSQPSAPSQQE